jgi:secreted protein with Ig-like and vWFA domain
LEFFKEDEQVGIITFDDEIEVIEELKEKKKIDKQSLFERLDSIHSRGGTNMEIGMRAAIQMLLSSPNITKKKRIIFLTDDCPNIGLDETGLKGMAENAFVN